MEIRSSVTPRSLRRLHWMLIPDPLEIGDVLCKMLALSNGSGISLATLGVAPVNVRGLIPGPELSVILLKSALAGTWDQVV